MKTQNVAQQQLMEVLSRRIEQLSQDMRLMEKNLASLKEAGPLISEHLQQVKKAVVRIDATPLHAFTAQLDARLPKAGQLLQVDSKPLAEFELRLSEQVKQLAKPVPVDSAPLQAFLRALEGHTQQLKRYLVIPRWLIYVVIGLSLWSIAATGLACWLYRDNVDKQERGQYWFEESQRLEKALQEASLPKKKGKKH